MNFLAYKSTGGSPLLKKQKKFRVGRAYLGLHVAPGLNVCNDINQGFPTGSPQNGHRGTA